MSRLARVGALVAVLLGSAAMAVGQAPVTVSPGEVDRSVEIEGSCPTFSFGGSGGGERWELVVYDLAALAEDRGPVLRKDLPIAIGSFTPRKDECLEPGRYGWSIRSVNGSGTSAWARPRLFEVSGKPPAADVVAAARLVRETLAALEDPPTPRGPDRPPRRDGGDESEGTGAQRVGAAGGVSTSLRVDGAVEAGYFVGDGSGLTSRPAVSDVVCSGCVGSADVSNGSIYGSDITNGSISSSDLAESSVGATELDEIRVVQVECAGDCDDAPLADICSYIGSSWEPIAVDCRNVEELASDSGTACGVNKCYDFGDIRTLNLGDLCDDESGGDAHVMCITP